jgi:hypothetical protein
MTMNIEGGTGETRATVGKTPDANTEHMESRRDFLGTIMRFAAFGALGTLGFLLIRKSMLWQSGQVCVGKGFCSSCVRNGSCSLREEQARRYLESIKGKTR